MVITESLTGIVPIKTAPTDAPSGYTFRATSDTTQGLCFKGKTDAQNTASG